MNFYRECARVVVVAILFLASVPGDALRAAEEQGGRVVQDLGEGLVYFRVTDLGGQLHELSGVLEKNRAVVVDLRGVAAAINEARALRSALLPRDAKTRVVRFVLINGATAPAIPFVLDAGVPDGGVPGVVIVAPAAAGVPTDVKAGGSVEDDKRACEAIARGSGVASLVNHQPEKKRYDEAVLVREHEGVPEPEGEAETNGESAPVADGMKAGGAQVKVLTDSVLQVAVQTHRALVALKKL